MSKPSMENDSVDSALTELMPNSHGLRAQLSGLKVSRVVTLASATGKYGGPYDTARRQAILLAEIGAEVTLLATNLPRDAPAEPSACGVHLTLAEARPLLPFGGYLSLLSVRAIKNLWRAIGISDVVHISFAREAFPLLAAGMCIARGKPWIAQTHGMMTSRRSIVHRIVDQAVLPLIRRSTIVITLTDREDRDLKRLGNVEGPKFCPLGNPLPEALVLDAPAKAPTNAVFIARLHPRKRVRDFVGAAEWAVNKKFPERYVVVGPDAGDLEAVKRGVRQLGNLDYRGAVSPAEVTDILRESAVFVLCSENEPWGNVLTTALALGIPVVVTRSSALADEIERVGAGIIVRDGEPYEIASAIHQIISDRETAAAMSAAGRAYAAARFTDDIQKKALHAVYQAVLGRSSTTGRDKD